MLQTEFSVLANDLAENFRNSVGKLRIGPSGYTPDMTAPEGPSTGGGVQSMQHVRLLPPEPSMPTLVVGHLDQRQRTAELRTFDHVDAICRERFKQGAPFESAQYEALLESMQEFLTACGMTVRRAGPPQKASPAEGQSIVPTQANAMLLMTVAAAVVLVGILAAALVWFFKK
jgi:hypothetical protein